jgi:hypothetical protein
MPEPNGQAAQEQPPEIEPGPIDMRVQVGRVMRPAGRYVMLRVDTAQGTTELYFVPVVAQALGRSLIEAASGIVLPGGPLP